MSCLTFFLLSLTFLSPRERSGFNHSASCLWVETCGRYYMNINRHSTKRYCRTSAISSHAQTQHSTWSDQYHQDKASMFVWQLLCVHGQMIYVCLTKLHKIVWKIKWSLYIPSKLMSHTLKYWNGYSYMVSLDIYWSLWSEDEEFFWLFCDVVLLFYRKVSFLFTLISFGQGSQSLSALSSSYKSFKLCVNVVFVWLFSDIIGTEAHKLKSTTLSSLVSWPVMDSSLVWAILFFFDVWQRAIQWDVARKERNWVEYKNIAWNEEQRPNWYSQSFLSQLILTIWLN